MAIKLNTKYLGGFIRDDEYEGMAPIIAAAHNTLVSGKGLGSDFLGWVDLPENYDKEEFERIKAAAERIRKSCTISCILTALARILVPHFLRSS